MAKADFEKLMAAVDTWPAPDREYFLDGFFHNTSDWFTMSWNSGAFKGNVSKIVVASLAGTDGHPVEATIKTVQEFKSLVTVWSRVRKIYRPGYAGSKLHRLTGVPSLPEGPRVVYSNASQRKPATSWTLNPNPYVAGRDHTQPYDIVLEYKTQGAKHILFDWKSCFELCNDMLEHREQLASYTVDQVNALHRDLKNYAKEKEAVLFLNPDEEIIVTWKEHWRSSKARPDGGGWIDNAKPKVGEGAGIGTYQGEYTNPSNEYIDDPEELKQTKKQTDDSAALMEDAWSEGALSPPDPRFKAQYPKQRWFTTTTYPVMAPIFYTSKLLNSSKIFKVDGGVVVAVSPDSSGRGYWFEFYTEEGNTKFIGFLKPKDALDLMRDAAFRRASSAGLKFKSVTSMLEHGSTKPPAPQYVSVYSTTRWFRWTGPEQKIVGFAGAEMKDPATAILQPNQVVAFAPRIDGARLMNYTSFGSVVSSIYCPKEALPKLMEKMKPAGESSKPEIPAPFQVPESNNNAEIGAAFLVYGKGTKLPNGPDGAGSYFTWISESDIINTKEKMKAGTIINLGWVKEPRPVYSAHLKDPGYPKFNFTSFPISAAKLNQWYANYYIREYREGDGKPDLGTKTHPGATDQNAQSVIDVSKVKAGAEPTNEVGLQIYGRPLSDLNHATVNLLRLYNWFVYEGPGVKIVNKMLNSGSYVGFNRLKATLQFIPMLCREIGDLRINAEEFNKIIKDCKPLSASQFSESVTPQGSQAKVDVAAIKKGSDIRDNDDIAPTLLGKPFAKLDSSAHKFLSEFYWFQYEGADFRFGPDHGDGELRDGDYVGFKTSTIPEDKSTVQMYCTSLIKTIDAATWKKIFQSCKPAGAAHKSKPAPGPSTSKTPTPQQEPNVQSPKPDKPVSSSQFPLVPDITYQGQEPALVFTVPGPVMNKWRDKIKPSTLGTFKWFQNKGNEVQIGDWKVVKNAIFGILPVEEGTKETTVLRNLNGKQIPVKVDALKNLIKQCNYRK